MTFSRVILSALALGVVACEPKVETSGHLTVDGEAWTPVACHVRAAGGIELVAADTHALAEAQHIDASLSVGAGVQGLGETFAVQA